MSIAAYSTLHAAPGCPLIILLDSQAHDGFAEQVSAAVSAALPEKPFTLLAAAVSDWDADYSPWPMAGLRPGESFAGRGEQTLSDLVSRLEAVRGEYRPSAVYIAGYSLAGLFSLWSLYESDLFDGCASCSGSLWFEGLEPYIRQQGIRRLAYVYLSLGGKEEKARDPILASIGDRTRAVNALLDRDPNVLRHTLVMNHGGHFTEPEKRVADGIVWLLKNA